MNNILKKLIQLLKKLINILEKRLEVEGSEILQENNKGNGKFAERVDWSISSDKELKPNEKYYLIELINNINIGNNCAELSYSELMILFNCKRKSHVIDKIRDLQNKGVIYVLVGNNKEKNKYIILKHLYLENMLEGNEEMLSKNMTSDNFVTTEMNRVLDDGAGFNTKSLEHKEVMDIIINNLEHYSKGIKINEEYLRKVTFNELVEK